MRVVLKCSTRFATGCVLQATPTHHEAGMYYHCTSRACFVNTASSSGARSHADDGWHPRGIQHVPERGLLWADVVENVVEEAAVAGRHEWVQRLEKDSRIL